MATYVVDSKPPALTIENTLGGKVFGPGEQVSIAWRVREGNLAPNPITIRMSSDAGYKWPITIAEGIANSGRHSFSLPSKPPASGRYYRVKIEVKDKVGHIGHAVSELFTIDAKPPTTRFLNVPKHLSKSPIALGVGVADQDGAGVAQVEVFQVKLDSGGRPVGKWSKRTISPWEGQNQVTFNLRDGYWGLLLVATDKKGNRQAVRGGDAQRMPTASTPPQERIQVHVQGPGVNLLTLAGGQTISGDKTQAIRWRTEQTSVPVTRVVISVSYDGGRTYAAIPGAETLQNTGRFEWKPPAGKDYPETRVRVEVFNRYGQRGMAASARNIYIDNGKPDVSGIEIEEDDEPRENDPEVKGWFKRQEDDRQPIILKPDPPKINPEDLSKKSVPDLSKKTVPVLSKKNMPASPKTNTENLSRLVGNAAQHYIDGSHRAAEQAMLAALQLRDNWGRGHYLLARICQQQGKPADVVRRLLQKATAFDSTLAEAYNDIGLIHYKQGQHTRAEAYFHRAIKARPLANAPRNKARFHYNLGLALWRQSKSRPAFAAFRDAVQFDPNFREAWFYVALLGDELGKQLVARDALARVVSLYPGTSDFHVWAKSKLR